MSRKLKRNLKKVNIEVKEPPKKLPPKITISKDNSAVPARKIKKIKRYKPQRCAYVDENGVQCRFKAVGKSTLCKKHGGDPIIKDNLITMDEASQLIIGASKFDIASHPILYIELSREGLSEVEIAAQFGVSVETIRKWAEKYEIFNRAYDIGKAMYEAWWLVQGKSGLGNRFFNTSLFKFLTSNKLGYSDKMETKALNMNVHGVLLVPDKVSEDEWEKDEDVIDV